MKQNHVRYESVLVTPTLAKKILDESNLGNRKLRTDYAKNLAFEILEGRWIEDTGVPIIFDEDNNLIDGQHRLNAVVFANTPVRFIFAYGVIRNAQDVIDTGLNRQASDVLEFNGVKNSRLVAAIIRGVLLNGNNGKSTKTTAHKNTPTNKIIKEEYFKDPIFWNNIAHQSQGYYRDFRGLGISLYGTFKVLALRESNHPQKVNLFFDQLASGNTTSPAILELRKKIINNQLSDKKLSTVSKRELVRSFFNAYVKDQKSPYSGDGKWL